MTPEARKRLIERDEAREKQSEKPLSASLKGPSMIEANLPVDGGAVHIAWPSDIREDEIDDVESWLEMMVRKMKRSASQPTSAKDQATEHRIQDHEEAEDE